MPLAVGTDLAGSIRQPAHACGIAGLLPRSGLLGEGGAFDTLPHLAAVRPRCGFLARRVSDLALACSVLVPRSVGQAPGEGRLRVGWWDEAGVLAPSAAIRRGVHEAVAHLSAAGYGTSRLEAAVGLEAAWLLLALLSADGGADIRRLFGGTQPMAAVAGLLRLAGLPRPLRHGLAMLARLGGRGIEAEALAATGPRGTRALEHLLAARAALADRVAAVAGSCDAIVCPVSAVPAMRHGTAAQLLPAAFPCLLANLLDLAAGAVPVTRVRADEESSRGPARDPIEQAARATDRGSRGLPVGVQVIALNGGERTVLEVMHVIEAGAMPAAAHAGEERTRTHELLDTRDFRGQVLGT